MTWCSMCDCRTDHDTSKHLTAVDPAVGRWVDGEAIAREIVTQREGNPAVARDDKDRKADA